MKTAPSGFLKRMSTLSGLSLRFHEDSSPALAAVDVAEAAAWAEPSAARAAGSIALGKLATSPRMRLNLDVILAGPPNIETVDCHLRAGVAIAIAWISCGFTRLRAVGACPAAASSCGLREVIDRIIGSKRDDRCNRHFRYKCQFRYRRQDLPTVHATIDRPFCRIEKLGHGSDNRHNR